MLGDLNLPVLNHAVSQEASCRICLDTGSIRSLIRPCLCRGSMEYVHQGCLQEWRKIRGQARSHYECDQCHYRYNLRRVDVANEMNVPYAFTATALLVTFNGIVGFSLVCGIVLGAQSWASVLFGTLLFGICCLGVLRYLDSEDFLFIFIGGFFEWRAGGLVAAWLCAVMCSWGGVSCRWSEQLVRVTSIAGLAGMCYILSDSSAHSVTAGIATLVLDIRDADPTLYAAISRRGGQ